MKAFVKRMSIMQVTYNSLLAAMMLFVVSCVGTVDTTEKEKTFFEEPSKATFLFTGIQDARPIAHDKIEVDFNAVGAGDLYDYYLYLNDAVQGLKLDLSTIKQVQGGTYRYILKGLQINTTYSLRLRATQRATGAKSVGENTAVVKTFDNQVADFFGVAKATLVPGQSYSSVKIEWNPATFVGGLSATSFDPVYYQVYYVTDEQGVAALEDPAIRTPIRKPGSGTISPTNHSENTSVTINSLVAGTTYHFMVRAFHKAYNDAANIDPNNISLNHELNSVYVTVTTDSGTSPVDFDIESLEIQNGASDTAFDTVRAFWQPGEGTYSGYRLFVKGFSGADIDNEDELDADYINELDGSGTNYKNLVIVSGSKPCETVNAPTSGIKQITFHADAKNDNTKVACYDFPTSMTSVELTGLTDYAPYQFKIALCRDNNCPLSASNPDGSTNLGMLSKVRSAITFPELAPFAGINVLGNPTDINNTDRISAQFNAVVTSQGYADTFEMYCVDPSDYSQRAKFPNDGTPISAAHPVTVCRNLTASRMTGGGALNQLDGFGTIKNETGIHITGISANGSTNYCFSITPAITQQSNAHATYCDNVNNPTSKYCYQDVAGNMELRLNPANGVRCIIPEIKVPNSVEFPGITGTCSVDEDQASISWPVPTGGLYDEYKVIYKEKNATPFNFLDAIGGSADYTIDTVADGTNTRTYTSFTPGATYQVGILTRLTATGEYSESNSGVVECKMPLPIATFNEWTRVLALGPKIDGRVPTIQDPADANPWPAFRSIDNGTFEGHIYEAVSPQGQPYEVSDPTEVLFPPPGEVRGVFSATSALTFDGAVSNNTDFGSFGASKNGIISLAWKEITLDFLDQRFKDHQTCDSDDDVGNERCDHKPAIAKNKRLFGYRVYRSDDYGSSWVNLTKQGESGTDERLVHTVSYDFYETPNAPAAQSQRMGFFTDYSVLYTHAMQDISRARLYLYKIVPVYAGREIKYDDNSSSPHHIIRVTLPPANMALIHRMMANRSTCMELGKYADIDFNNHYRCDWNGLGGRAKGYPWQVNNTAIDQGGDLLVDRFELGCNITRGSNNPSYQTGESFYHRDTFNAAGNSWTDLSNFVGVTTDVGGNNTTTPFRGCVTKYANNWGKNSHEGVALTAPFATDPYGPGLASIPYDKTIMGDCIGNDYLSAPRGYCPSGNADCGGNETRSLTFPGASMTLGLGPSNTFDNTQNNSDAPQFLFGTDNAATVAADMVTTPGDSANARVVGLLARDFRKNLVAQGEFGAVYYNASVNSGSAEISAYGQGYSNAANSHEELSSVSTNWTRKSTCYLNLPSIDADGTWRSRWFGPRELGNVIYQNASDGVTAAEARASIISKTINEVRASRAFYDNNIPGEVSPDYTDPLTLNPAFLNTNRLTGDMKLGRVISSNSAKLPPLVGASQETLNELCTTYRVQVGIENTNGNFIAMDAPAKKRLLSRDEQIRAAAWPDNFDRNMIIALEKGNGIDNSANQKYLNAPAGDPTGNDYRVSACKAASHPLTGGYTPAINANLGSSYASSNFANNPFATGSGRLDGNDRSHTGHCQSRYGIQDLVGNALEVNSTQIFCDYSTESMALYFGDYSGGIGTISDSLGLTIVNPSGQEAGVYYYRADATICKITNTDPDAGGTEWTQEPGTFAADGSVGGAYNKYCRTNNIPWQYVDINAGYCSVVDSNRNRPMNPGNFRDPSDTFYDVVNPDGSVNSTMITRPNSIDPLNVLGFRNGDGQFLNFGSANLSPALKDGGTMTFVSNIVNGSERMANNLYFSPLLGLPLSCGTYTPGVEACDATMTPDNMNYTLSSFHVNHEDGTPPAMINNAFFIGNSAGTSRGIGDTRGSTSPTTINYGGATDSGSRRIVSSIIELPGGSVIYDQINSSDEAIEQLGVPVYQFYWDVDRGTVMTTYSGGSASASKAGRYSIDIEPSSRNGYETGRCAVIVNQDE